MGANEIAMKKGSPRSVEALASKIGTAMDATRFNRLEQASSCGLGRRVHTSLRSEWGLAVGFGPPEPQPELGAFDREARSTSDECDFVCAWCGRCWPWSGLAGYDLPRRICESCVEFLAALSMGERP